MPPLLLLCHTSVDPVKLKNIAIRQGKPVYWVFLCQDYPKLLEWKQILDEEFIQINLAASLQRIAYKLRKPFLDLLTAMGGHINSTAWWASRVSERNTMQSFLFLYCCYVHLINEKIKNLSGTVCVICESWAVLDLLAEQSKKCNEFSILFISCPDRLNNSLSWVVDAFSRIIGLLKKIIQSKTIKNSSIASVKDGQPVIMIHTYVDDGCFLDDGSFQDKYFPGLYAWLVQRGYSIITLPVLFNLKKSFRLTWHLINQNSQALLNPYKYYKAHDIVFALAQAWHQMSMFNKPISLEGFDVQKLFQEENKRHAFSTLDSLLYYRLPKRMIQQGININILIMEYENMINEKILNLGFKHYSPHTKIVGYQHAALYPLFLCLFITHKEVGFAPLPDRVVCNGEFFLDILTEEGFPRERCVVGPALRYGYLWQSMDQDKNDAVKEIDIFVPLPLPLNDSVELLTKLLEAFKEEKKYRLTLKPHPMSSLNSILKAARVMQLPRHFTIIDTQTMAILLPKAKIVITLSSNTIFESLAYGVPVIVVGRESSIDLNPLAYYSDFKTICRTPEEIKDEAWRLLNLSPDELEGYKKRGKEIIKKSFTRVSDSAMETFISGFTV